MYSFKTICDGTTASHNTKATGHEKFKNKINAQTNIIIGNKSNVNTYRNELRNALSSIRDVMPSAVAQIGNVTTAATKK